RHHRDLHSFPTRRSSDLGGGLSARPDAGSNRWPLGYRIKVCENYHKNAECEMGNAGLVSLLRLPGGTHLPNTFRIPHSAFRLRPDRKSTRLNSSHLGISY